MSFSSRTFLGGFLASALATPGVVHEHSPSSVRSLAAYNVTRNSSFEVYSHEFTSILGNSPSLNSILTSANASFTQFHEAGILFQEKPNPVLFITSNQYDVEGSPTTNNKAVAISKVSYDGNAWNAEIVKSTGYPVSLANGGCKYKEGIVLLDQGTLTTHGGLVYMNGTAPYGTSLLIDNFYGHPFNSPNDVVAASDGALWFTDPSYGSWQGIRGDPRLPPQVYRFMPGTNNIRVVADGLDQPNGIAFSPDEKTVYITDATGNSTALTSPRTIYAYDVVKKAGQPSLINKRVFAMAEKGLPDGIKTDAEGNVYVGCGDGVSVWNAGGMMLGKIKVEGGSANLVLGEGKVWLLNELQLWEASVATPAPKINDVKKDD
ncbi:hypothetical protein HYALB_00005016 [Hymenoscyphus albidus]|uniref:SMP-30/Gluconolactonase/LRE-like region domain-containing protein n=1 Tax=Hymenoscyphus albidus TaxID=595503 RepID=A0A9N9LEM3_9HELO|nr:hypothetical protein HYALB_00005016 [Hymenoscyphus albidus]